jgi:hypothetical protein
MRGACLLSRRSEDVSIFFGRASVHCEDLLVPLRIARGGLLNSLVAETLRSTFSEKASNQRNIVGSAWRREARNVGKYSA